MSDGSHLAKNVCVRVEEAEVRISPFAFLSRRFGASVEHDVVLSWLYVVFLSQKAEAAPVMYSVMTTGDDYPLCTLMRDLFCGPF
ncbi:hypothetical protein ApDm4_1449 [Acetobacter pomorum]|nr:hypothetical protein ApDm4_1449 [Acetobacter pomorum]